MDKSLSDQMRQFFDIWAAIEKHYDRYAKSVGLTYQGLCILDIIYETPENCTQKLICEQANLPKQSVNLVIRSFWEQGYIEMKEIAEDRRNKAIWFSESGREYAGEILGRLAEAEEAAIGHIPYEQRQVMIEIMEKMEHSFRTNIDLAMAFTVKGTAGWPDDRGGRQDGSDSETGSGPEHAVGSSET